MRQRLEDGSGSALCPGGRVWRGGRLLVLLLAAVTGAVGRAAGPMDPLPAEDVARIQAAIPTRAPAAPQNSRRLLVYTGNVGYGGHRSMAYAAEALRLMGEATGAFGTEVASDPAVFGAENLRRFDAVFLNNTVGNLTEDAALRASLLDFILRGGGLMGVHGTSVAFTKWPGAVEDWPEFGRIIGGRGANHRDSDEHVFLKLDDPGHPLTAMFPVDGFDYRDEFFRVHEPYSRGRVRVLLSFDTAKTDMEQGAARGDCVRADGDYAVAWVRGYGRGRAFYCTIAHNPYVFWDRRMLEFYLAAAQFALGDLAAPLTPSGRLTPAVRAQEQLGWRPAVDLGSVPLRHVLENWSVPGLTHVGLKVGQALGGGSQARLRPGADARALAGLRLKLDDAGLRVLTLAVDTSPADVAGWGQCFELADRLGAEVLVGDPGAALRSDVARVAGERRVRLAQPVRTLAELEAIVGVEGRDLPPSLGVWVDMTAWRRAGLDAVDLVRRLGSRLAVVRLTACEPADEGWLRLIRDQGIAVASVDVGEADPRTVAAFEALCLKLAPEARRPVNP